MSDVINLLEQAIRQHVGSTYYSRGREYFLSGRVKSIKYEGNAVWGKVKGSKPKPYEVGITLKDGKIVESICSCPMEYACKHVAALGCKVLVDKILSRSQTTPQPTTPNQSNSTKPDPRWVKKLESWEKQSDVSPARPEFELQIIFCLEPKDAYGYRQNYLPYMYGHKSEEKLWRLILRPRLYDPADGSFSATVLKWNFVNQYNHLYWDGKSGELPQDNLLFLKLLHSALGHVYGDWAEVSEEDAENVWRVICDHEKYNVKLVAGKKGNISVNISQIPAKQALVIDENGKDLTLKKGIVFKNGEPSPLNSLILGKPPKFILILEGAYLDDWNFAQSFTLAQVTGKIPSAYGNNIHPILIPENKITSFQNEHLKKLASKYTLISLTPEITVPKVYEPRAVIRIKNCGPQQITVKVDDDVNDASLSDYIIDERSRKEVRQIAAGKLKELFPQIWPQETFYGRVSEELTLQELPAARFFVEGVEKIKNGMDIPVLKDPDIPDYTFDQSEAEIELGVDKDTEGNDWFDLQIKVKVGGQDVPFSKIFTALSQGEEFVLLENGHYFPLDQAKFVELKKLLDEANKLRDGNIQGLKISHFQIGFWEELERLGIVKQQAEKWQKIAQELKSISKIIPLPPSRTFKGMLRPYQIEGWTWLEFLRRYRLGGILADDMGLGKTVQAIALFTAINRKERENKPFLVIAPTSVVENWDAELERFAPQLKKVILRSGDRNREHKRMEHADVVVTSYPLLIRDFEKLKNLDFDTIILDEAQMVKNHQSKIYSHIKMLKGAVKIALTGTPLENSLVELWAILSITCPGIFPSLKNFHESYRIPIERNQDKNMLEKLRRRIRPFMLRRKKESVEKELPQKTVQTLMLTMNEEHSRIYNLHLQKERQRVLGLLESGGFRDHRFEILKSLTTMRRLCLHPRLIDEEYAHVDATKIGALAEQVSLLAKENHKMLIFSQFTSFLAIVKETLDQQGLDYLYLDGQTKNRGELVKKFQNGGPPIFLISLKAGGFGLNLTAADYCFLLDPWWNPAVEKQAVDRAHRIGQTRPVFVYKFILKDTVEEKVLKLQEKKERLFKNVLEDGDVFGSLVSEEDVRRIFS